MSFRRVGRLAALALATLLEISCGQVYRPVVIPVSITPPDPANFHAVFGISTNVPFNPGTALQIDVSGDTNIGVANMGVNPTHAAILPNNARVFVASAGSMFQGDADTVVAFSPAAQSSVATGLGNATTYSLPYGSLPVFVNTTQNNIVFVANYGTNSVSALNPGSGVVTLTAPTGHNPVAMAETPDEQNLYVVNQGDNAVMDLAPVDLTPLATIPVGSNPVWEVARLDSRRLYVVTQGDGTLYTINTASNTVISIESVGGPGANFVLYDPSRNRLYVTNPNAGAVYVFDATTDPPSPLNNSSIISLTESGNVVTATLGTPLAGAAPGELIRISGAGAGGYDGIFQILSDSGATITYSDSNAALPPSSGGIAVVAISPPQQCSVAGGTCPVAPVSVAALPDGSRFYVASYATAATGMPCPDPTQTAAGCLIPQLTVFDAASFTVKVFPSSPVAPSLSLLMPPQFAAGQYAVPAVSTCAAVVPYTPFVTSGSTVSSTVRFRMFAAAAADSSHVYTSICDAGVIADIDATTSSIGGGTNNTPDTLMTNLAAPFSAGPPGSNGEPPPQNPVFLLTGQ